MGPEVREMGEGLQLSWLNSVGTGCFLLMVFCIFLTGHFVASYYHTAERNVLKSAVDTSSTYWSP